MNVQLQWLYLRCLMFPEGGLVLTHSRIALFDDWMLTRGWKTHLVGRCCSEHEASLSNHVFFWPQRARKFDVPKKVLCVSGWCSIGWNIMHIVYTILVDMLPMLSWVVWKSGAWKTSETAYIRVQTCPRWKIIKLVLLSGTYIPRIQLLWIPWVT